MTDLDVHLYQEDSPARQWVVDLRKPGARLTVYRLVRDCLDQARAVAANLSAFLCIPLVMEEGKTKE